LIDIDIDTKARVRTEQLDTQTRRHTGPNALLRRIRC